MTQNLKFKILKFYLHFDQDDIQFFSSTFSQTNSTRTGESFTKQVIHLVNQTLQHKNDINPFATNHMMLLLILRHQRFQYPTKPYIIKVSYY